jgi:stalled ribosome alternative rescue factor ArfA
MSQVSLSCWSAFLILTFAAGTLEGGPVRLERGKPSLQSSTYRGDPQFGSGKANDDQAYDNSVARTELEVEPWWEIDLQGEYALDNITVLAPVAFGAGWLRTFQVLLSSDGLNYKLIYTHGGGSFRNRAVPAGGLTARYVRIRLQERQILALQEVWIFKDGSVPSGPRPVRWTPVQIPGARHPGAAAPPVASSPSTAKCDSLAGVWSWFNGRTVTITADGRVSTDNGGKGSWRKTGAQAFQLRWETYNTTDNVTMSNDGGTLTGVFNGNQGTCRRRSGDCMAASSSVTTAPVASTPASPKCDSLAGIWSWFNGRTVTITADGRVSTDNGGKGSWRKTGAQTFQLRWETYNTTDNVTLSNDGGTLTGVFNGNQGTCRRRSGDCMAGSSSVTAAPVASSPASAKCDSLAGVWSWFNGRTVTITADGRVSTDNGGKGSWRKTGAQAFQLRWETYNTTDNVTLSGDGGTLTGVFNGNQGTCRRRSGDCMAGSGPAGTTSGKCDSLAGVWIWFNGRVVTITADGRVSTDNGGKGSWRRTGAQAFQLRWETYNTTDNVTLSTDGGTLTGVFNGNQGNCRRRSGDCMAGGRVTPIPAASAYC